MNFFMFITMVLSLLVLPVSYADDGVGALLSKVQNTNISPEEVVKDMQQKLDLTDEQAQQALPVITRQTEAIQQITEQLSKGDVDEATITHLEDMRNTANDDLARIFTPEQMAKWQALMAQGQARVTQMMQASGIGQEQGQE